MGKLDSLKRVFSKKVDVVKSILVVDDSDTNRYILKKFIKLYDSSLKVLEAKNGQEAIDIFSKNSDIVLVLMDIVMPFKDGYTATREIRSISKTIPVYIITGVAYEQCAKKSYECGVNGMLYKPIDINILYTTLQLYT